MLALPATPLPPCPLLRPALKNCSAPHPLLPPQAPALRCAWACSPLAPSRCAPPWLVGRASACTHPPAHGSSRGMIPLAVLLGSACRSGMHRPQAAIRLLYYCVPPFLPSPFPPYAALWPRRRRPSRLLHPRQQLQRRRQQRRRSGGPAGRAGAAVRVQPTGALHHHPLAHAEGDFRGAGRRRSLQPPSRSGACTPCPHPRGRPLKGVWPADAAVLSIMSAPCEATCCQTVPPPPQCWEATPAGCPHPLPDELMPTPHLPPWHPCSPCSGPTGGCGGGPLDSCQGAPRRLCPHRRRRRRRLPRRPPHAGALPAGAWGGRGLPLLQKYAWGGGGGGGPPAFPLVRPLLGGLSGATQRPGPPPPPPRARGRGGGGGGGRRPPPVCVSGGGGGGGGGAPTAFPLLMPLLCSLSVATQRHAARPLPRLLLPLSCPPSDPPPAAPPLP
mgnify:CR=1 FL=1